MIFDLSFIFFDAEDHTACPPLSIAEMEIELPKLPNKYSTFQNNLRDIRTLKYRKGAP